MNRTRMFFLGLVCFLLSWPLEYGEVLILSVPFFYGGICLMIASIWRGFLL